MNSYWTVSFVGPYTSNFVKKLERFLKIKALEIERQRFIDLDNRNFERRTFFVKHDVDNWPNLIADVLGKAARITPEWLVVFYSEGHVVATYDSDFNEKKGWSYQVRGPSDLHRIKLEIKSDQKYIRTRVWDKEKDEW